MLGFVLHVGLTRRLDKLDAAGEQILHLYVIHSEKFKAEQRQHAISFLLRLLLRVSQRGLVCPDGGSQRRQRVQCSGGSGNQWPPGGDSGNQRRQFQRRQRRSGGGENCSAEEEEKEP